MQFQKTEFEGLIIIEPNIYEDDRGYFFESFNQATSSSNGLLKEFVQDNESMSKKGVVRGFHYQKSPFAQAKLVRVIKGCVQDVVIDMRSSSKTFGKSYSIILSEENKKQMLIPRGFAHAFLSLEDQTIFSYKCDNYYSKVHECGLHPILQDRFSDWELDIEEAIVSEKDLLLPNFEDAFKFR